MVVEVVLGVLQTQVSKSSGWHETPFHVAGTLASTPHDILLLGELLLQPLLLILFVGVERFAYFHSLICVIGRLPNQNRFRITSIGHV